MVDNQSPRSDNTAAGKSPNSPVRRIGDQLRLAFFQIAPYLSSSAIPRTHGGHAHGQRTNQGQSAGRRRRRAGGGDHGRDPGAGLRHLGPLPRGRAGHQQNHIRPGIYLGHYSTIDAYVIQLIDDYELDAKLDAAVAEPFRRHVDINVNALGRALVARTTIYTLQAVPVGVWVFNGDIE